MHPFKYMRKIITVFFVLLTIQVHAQKKLSEYVNPFIGTGGHGHTYPGATMPHGMVQLSPDTRLDGWDGCGGYHYSDSFIYGFSHTHLSGTGVSDYGDILVMPMNGKPSPDNKVYGSAFSHVYESATAGYYSVLLSDDKIKAELTATERTGFHHYTFSKTEQNNIIIDLKHRDEVIESSLRLEDSVTVTGMRRSRAWATNQYVFFVMKLSSPVSKHGVWQNNVLQEGLKFAEGKDLKAYLTFELPNSNDVFIKVAISSVSIEGAKRNLSAELPGWNFPAVKKQAQDKWDKELSVIEVSSSDENKLKIFYTSLYHTAIVPNINMDVDGSYRGRDDKIHVAKGFTNYSVFSLWDTYRATHPLYTIIDRGRTLDYIKTFLAQYEQGGRLPVWELASNETDCMIGYHSVSVITDAYMKGIRNFDTRLALEAMKKSANWNHLGLPAYIEKGLIETDDDHESVSKALEYAYDDFCIAQFASATKNESDHIFYLKRAQYYKNLIDENGFVHPRKNGDWLKPFDPREVNNHFTEANSWQYSFSFPHDIAGYIGIRGGVKKLEDQLDNLFSAPSQTTGRDQSDITGLIGQYAHGNEPSHHISYLYNYTGSAHKTQKLVHTIMNTMYTNAPDGLIGNEDCGQMSAWYIFSSLGFYPVVPGTTYYAMGTPSFISAKINLENGRSFEIKADNVSEKNFYVSEAALYSKIQPQKNQFKDVSVLQHNSIMAGGQLIFKMTDKPSPFFSKNYVKGGLSDNKHIEYIVLNPVIHGGGVPFRKSKMVSITAEAGNKIYYSTDGSTPSKQSNKYETPLLVDKTMTIKTIAYNQKGAGSFVTTAVYKKLPNDWKVSLNTPFEKQYDGGGADGLADGLRGSTDWRKGNWQGYQKEDVDAVIDLQSAKKISRVDVGFLQDTRAWIVMPLTLSVEVSLDNKNYTTVFEGNDFLPLTDLTPQTKNIAAVFSSVDARYVRIRAKQFGKLPAWHEGAGGDTHIFIDEVSIK